MSLGLWRQLHSHWQLVPRDGHVQRNPGRRGVASSRQACLPPSSTLFWPFHLGPPPSLLPARLAEEVVFKPCSFCNFQNLPSLLGDGFGPLDAGENEPFRPPINYYVLTVLNLQVIWSIHISVILHDYMTFAPLTKNTLSSDLIAKSKITLNISALTDPVHPSSLCILFTGL